MTVILSYLLIFVVSLLCWAFSHLKLVPTYKGMPNYLRIPFFGCHYLIVVSLYLSGLMAFIRTGELILGASSGDVRALVIGVPMGIIGFLVWWYGLHQVATGRWAEGWYKALAYLLTVAGQVTTFLALILLSTLVL